MVQFRRCRSLAKPLVQPRCEGAMEAPSNAVDVAPIVNSPPTGAAPTSLEADEMFFTANGDDCDRDDFSVTGGSCASDEKSDLSADPRSSSASLVDKSSLTSMAIDCGKQTGTAAILHICHVGGNVNVTIHRHQAVTSLCSCQSSGASHREAGDANHDPGGDASERTADDSQDTRRTFLVDTGDPSATAVPSTSTVDARNTFSWEGHAVDLEAVQPPSDSLSVAASSPTPSTVPSSTWLPHLPGAPLQRPRLLDADVRITGGSGGRGGHGVTRDAHAHGFAVRPSSRVVGDVWQTEVHTTTISRVEHSAPPQPLTLPQVPPRLSDSTPPGAGLMAASGFANVDDDLVRLLVRHPGPGGRGPM